MSYTTLDVQLRLKRLGINPGPIDGILGPKTSNAIRKFKKLKGLPDTNIVGPLTIAALFDDKPLTLEAVESNLCFEPVWLQVAKNYIGVEEVQGYRHNPIILGWWQRCGLPFKDDETPWCAGFIGGCLEESGIRSSRSGLALSYSQFGINLSGPAVGCIATMKRSGGGHVIFIVGRTKNGKLLGLGGNQGNAVNIKEFDPKRIIAYTWPAGVPRPINVGMTKLPVLKSNGQISINEA